MQVNSVAKGMFFRSNSVSPVLLLWNLVLTLLFAFVCDRLQERTFTPCL